MSTRLIRHPPKGLSRIVPMRLPFESALLSALRNIPLALQSSGTERTVTNSGGTGVG